MIGHVILQKSYDGEDLLKVSGDKLLASGSRGAVVDAVKCGSIADQEGHILAGEYHAFLKCGSTLHVHTLSHPPPTTSLQSKILLISLPVQFIVIFAFP